MPGARKLMMAKPPFSVVNTDSAQVSAGSDVYTFSNRSLGDPHASRVIYVAVGSASTGGKYVESVTLDGVAMDLVHKHEHTRGNQITFGYLYKKELPTGSTGTIVVSGGNSSQFLTLCSIGVFAAYGDHQVNLEGGNGANADNVSVTGITTPLEAHVIAAGGILDDGGNDRHGGVAYQYFEAGLSGATISIANVGSAMSWSGITSLVAASRATGTGSSSTGLLVTSITPSYT